jgi:peptide/nickel transport system substrate-binding protein
MFSRALSLGVVATFLMTACVPVAPSASPGAAPSSAALGTVTFRVFSNVASFGAGFDIAGAQNTTGPQILYQFYDKLVTLARDPKDPSKVVVTPYLATKWEQTESSITFTLRKDATCADGTPVTPTVVRNSYEYAFKGPNIFAMFGPGPFEFSADEAAGTFTWRSAVPFSDAIFGFAGDRLQPITCPAGLADPASMKTTPAGSGPYTIVEAVVGDRVVMKRRDDWKWGPNGITARDIPEQLVFKNIQNDTTAANLLLSGGLDIAQISGPDVPRLLADKSLISKTTTSTYNYNLVFNEKEGQPANDIKVREALVSAIDPAQWNQAASQGRGEVSPSFLMPQSDCFDPTTANYRVKDPSPDKARAMLLAAGWTARADGKLEKNGKPLTIVLPGSEATLGKGPEYVGGQWDKAGVSVDLQITDYGTYSAKLSASNFDAFPTTYPFDIPVPGMAINRYTGAVPPQGQNAAYILDPELDAAMLAAYRSTGAERCKQWGIVQQALVKRFHILPLASPHVIWFSKGIEFEPMALSIDPRFMRPAKK